MTDNTITLFCLIHGTPPSQSLQIIIAKDKNVAGLRSAIKQAAPNDFHNVDAHRLQLWKVNIDLDPPSPSPGETLLNNLTADPTLDIKSVLNGQELRNPAKLLVGQNGCWTQDPPQSHIHVIVKVISKQLTERQLLMLRPPSLSYASDSQRKKKSKTTTKSTWARTPISVVHWQNFIHQARIMASNDTTPQYDEPTFRNFVEISEEEDVRVALQINVLETLTDSIGSKQMPKEEFRRHSVLEKVQGKPDFIMRAVDRLMFAIEVKTKWVLSVDDIVAMYQDNLTTLAAHRAPPISVIDPIKQIYGYMGHNKLQYGVLSTYERTWFFWRPQGNPDVLRISNVVKNTDTNPTLLRSLVYIMSLARHNPDSPSPPASPPPPTDDYEPPDEEDDDGDSTYYPPKGSSSRSGRGGQGGNRGGAGKRGSSSNTAKRNQSQIKGKQRAAGNEQSKGVLRLEDFGWDSFDVVDVLGNGRCGTVFKAVLRGEEVALKLCDLWQCPGYEEELLTEAKTYMALEQLQGRTIPKLKGAGYTAGGLFAIATEIMGSPIEVEELSDQERNEIVNALSDIHDHGVLHNDIRPENILIQRHCDGFKAVFIDFAFSERASNKEELENEMAILKKMLGLRPIIKNGKFKKPRRSPRLDQTSDSQDPGQY